MVKLSIERRSHSRFLYEAEISHDLLEQNHIYPARLFNISRGGLYFESDQAIFPGEEIFIQFKNTKDAVGDDFISQLPFGVEVVWQNGLIDSNFRYGYGAHYLDNNDSLVKSIKFSELEQEINLEAEKDPREHPRKQYRKSLFLTHRRRRYRGEFVNISRGGVFIRTDIKFTVGKPVRIVIPGGQREKSLILKGIIVRSNTDGFGVKFDRKSHLVFRDDLERRNGFESRNLKDRRGR